MSLLPEVCNRQTDMWLRRQSRVTFVVSSGNIFVWPRIISMSRWLFGTRVWSPLRATMRPPCCDDTFVGDAHVAVDSDKWARFVFTFTTAAGWRAYRASVLIVHFMPCACVQQPSRQRWRRAGQPLYIPERSAGRGRWGRKASRHAEPTPTR